MIMVALPFTLVGVCLGFLITGRVFDILAMIGVIMLIGIVVNNSIILIDFVNKRRGSYETAREAIIAAAKARLRPVFTTTITTVGGLTPMFIGGTNSSDFQTPIATAVIFGLLFSTLVTLVLVPVLYELFERRSKKHQFLKEEVVS
jgi:HAE1 family hydrophobic/amphiphilic exporter-1